MAATATLTETLRQAFKGRRNVVEKKMFGGHCWLLRGNMICGDDGDGRGRYMFRVGKEQEAQALARPGAVVMDITGKPMRGFVWVDAEKAKGKALLEWIAFAERYVGKLPAK